MKLLLITYHFLQSNEPSSIQARRFFTSLADSGVKITIITKKVKQRINFFHKNIEIIEVFGFESRVISAVLRLFLKDLTLIPDLETIFWNPFVVYKIKKTIDLHQYSLIHTISYPFSTHLIPIKLNVKNKLPWVAQFYDPWIENSFRDYSINAFSNWNLKMEELVANQANMIIHSNNHIVRSWSIRYGLPIESKILTLPFCIDDTNSSVSTKIKSNSKIILSHIGSLYGRRNLDIIILVLQRLKQSHEIHNLNFCLNLVGFVSKDELNKIKNSSISDLIKIIGKIPYEQSLAFIQDSDILLLIEDNSDESYFFPSKLTDYLKSNKPILAITSNKSIVNTILNKSGQKTFNYNQIDILHYDLLVLIQKLFRNEKIEYTYDLDEFLPKSVVKKYLDFLGNYSICSQ
jgi:hypothetical protein